MAKSLSEQKDILLTGASGAIGGAIARRLAKGPFRLHLTSRNPKRLGALTRDLPESGVAPVTYALDLLNRAQCINVVTEFFKNAPNPSGLICNAGDLGVLGPFLKSDFTAWAQSIEQNFLSHALMIQTWGRCFAKAKKKSGSIVVLSGAGLGSAIKHANLSSYGASKAALTYLAEALQLELAPLDITINAIAPGQVNSGITEQAIRAGTDQLGEYAVSAQQCKASGGVSPDLAAQLVEFLMSPAARHITGRLISARFDQNLLREETEDVARDPHLYRLRRIDHDLFGPLKKL